MIQSFREGLKPLVEVEIEERDRELDRFDEMVERVVDTKPKADLSPGC